MDTTASVLLEDRRGSEGEFDKLLMETIALMLGDGCTGTEGIFEEGPGGIALFPASAAELRDASIIRSTTAESAFHTSADSLRTR